MCATQVRKHTKHAKTTPKPRVRNKLQREVEATGQITFRKPKKRPLSLRFLRVLGSLGRLLPGPRVENRANWVLCQHVIHFVQRHIQHLCIAADLRRIAHGRPEPRRSFLDVVHISHSQTTTLSLCTSTSTSFVMATLAVFVGSLVSSTILSSMSVRCLFAILSAVCKSSVLFPKSVSQVFSSSCRRFVRCSACSK